MKKNILIIGGSSGIGLQIVKKLNEEHNVFVANRTNESLSGLNHQYIKVDVSKETLDSSYLPDSLDGLVYCPGSINLRPFRGLKPETFIEDFNLNVMGAVRSINAVLKNLNNSSQASIVLFSTVAVQIGMPFHSCVAVSKGAIEGLTRSLAAELAPKISVNAIAPSIVNTPLAEKFLNNESKMERAVERHPLKKVGSADEIANFAIHLLFNSSWMTGQILGVDGGIGSTKV
ncbi:MAG: oxidoreductase [Flavobacteriaceae bacterium TMED116]|nr:MAG: oxidoreductase [Flavobacteriaceae bacterium TMED116]|tara:strand:- start:6729 stop:7421 length:693 start_codon:yes stop_codon:yes gene_type:complete